METVSDQASKIYILVRGVLKIYILVRGVLKIYILVRGVDVDARLEEEKVEDGIVASTSCIPVKNLKPGNMFFLSSKSFKIVHEAGDSPWASGVNWLSTV